MEKMTFTVDIKAPKQHVWEVMLSDDTYRQWTTPFHEGSFYQGSWDEGSQIKFLAEDDGELSGMFSKIAQNNPYNYISIEHLGEIVDGEEDTTSDNAKQWAGAHENYTFTESDGVTTVTVDLEGAKIAPELTEMFEAMWPQALTKLKDLAEK